MPDDETPEPTPVEAKSSRRKTITTATKKTKEKKHEPEPVLEPEPLQEREPVEEKRPSTKRAHRAVVQPDVAEAEAQPEHETGADTHTKHKDCIPIELYNKVVENYERYKALRTTDEEQLYHDLLKMTNDKERGNYSVNTQ